jgi:hypothetical protein
MEIHGSFARLPDLNQTPKASRSQIATFKIWQSLARGQRKAAVSQFVARSLCNYN